MTIARMIELTALMLMISELCIIGGRYAAVKDTPMTRVALEGLLIAVSAIVLIYCKAANIN